MDLPIADVPPSPVGVHAGFWPKAGPRHQWHFWAALILLAIFGFFAFVRGSRVPLIGWLDLAVHEFGHVWTLWMPRVLNLAMGSGTQVMLPLGIAAGLWWRSRDPMGAAIALGWAGTSAQDASTYIADAPFERLQLIGGVHDWATLLGPLHLDAMDLARPLSWLAWSFGLCCWLAAVGVCARELRRLRASLPVEGLPSTWSTSG